MRNFTAALSEQGYFCSQFRFDVFGEQFAVEELHSVDDLNKRLKSIKPLRDAKAASRRVKERSAKQGYVPLLLFCFSVGKPDPDDIGIDICGCVFPIKTSIPTFFLAEAFKYFLSPAIVDG